MKHGGTSDDFHAWLNEHEHLLSEWANVYDEEIYLYIFTIDSRKATLDRIDQIKDPAQRHIAMNIAQQLEHRGIQQGKQQGMQQGKQQEKLHIARNMLIKLHMDVMTVSEATGLSKGELIKLQEEEAAAVSEG